jgi:hypothetical protein
MPPIQQPSPNPGLNLFLFSIPQSTLLQIGTVAVLTVLLTEKAASKVLTSLGEVSEELFRGDRLPLLDFPEVEETNQS